MGKSLEFGTAFKYPFNRSVGLLNILWMFIPILGWFALGGYIVRIIKGFTEGKFKELPKMAFWDDFVLGFMMFLKALPFLIALIIVFWILEFIPYLGYLVQLFIDIFILPILGINFIKKQTVASYFEFGIIKDVFENIGDYLMAVLKTILLAIIFGVMCIVLVGIPALSFTQNIFLADFYKRNVK